MIPDAKAALRASVKLLAVVAVFSFVVNALMLTLPFYMMQSFDRVLPARSEDTLWVLTLIAVCLLAVMAALDVVRSRILVRLSSWFDHMLSPPLIRAAVQAASFNRSVSATQTLRDMSTVRQFMTGTAIFAVMDAPWVPLFLAIIFLIHPVLGGFATLGAVILFGLAWLNDALTRKPLEDANAIANPQMSKAGSFSANAEVIEAMGMLGPMLQRWHEKNLSTLVLQSRASDRAGLISGITKAVRMLIQIALMAAGLYLALENLLTPGAMIAASIIMGRALAPVEQLVGTWRNVVQARESFARINGLLGNFKTIRTTTEFDTVEGGLSVEGVSYQFPGAARPTLQGVTFALEAGDVLGIVGPTAAGKSTLARQLVGVWPTMGGKVRLGGVDVFTWNRDNFGRFVGYLPQDVELFAGTVKENIARMTEADDASVIAAAKAANAHEMIVHLPLGYDTPVGDGGTNLSGGQRQRIGLARALFGDPKYLVLDEPNANLDNEGEQALVQAIQAAQARGAIVIVISHRTGILSAVSKMLVLREGRVQMFGPKDQVLAQINQQQRNAAVQAQAQQRIAPVQAS